MTCDDLDHLAERAEDRCEICGTVADETTQGKLHIDHDHARGSWAVRGLLCQNCNTKLHEPWAPHREAAAKYLSAPWIDQRYAGQLTWIPEPPNGASILIWGRTMTRRRGKWHALDGYRGGIKTWAELMKLYAPHRLKVLSWGRNGAPQSGADLAAAARHAEGDDR